MVKMLGHAMAPLMADKWELYLVEQKANDLEHRMEQLLVEQKVYMMVSLMVYTMECMMV